MLGDKPNFQRIDHIKVMSTRTIKVMDKEAEQLIEFIDMLLTDQLQMLTIPEIDMLNHHKHLLMNAKPDMVF